MTQISQVINVTVNVADTQITRAGFGTLGILDQFATTVFPERTKLYTDLVSIAADFATTSKVYKAAAAAFGQKRGPKQIKVLRKDSGDASFTTALDAIVAEDPDWYGLAAVERVKANIQLIAAWTKTKNKIYIGSSEDADVITTATTDIASVLKGLAYTRTGYLWHHQAGLDVTGAAYTVTSGVATIVQTAHTLKVNDPVTFSASSGASIDGDSFVASVPNANTFTIATTAINEPGAVTVSYFARYTFPEFAWMGQMLASDPGSETWKFKQLIGITPAPLTSLTSANEATALGKNANLYTPLAGIGHTQEGVMSGGRFIDIQRGIDWLEARIGESIASRLLNSPIIPYTDAGATVIQAEISSIMDEGVRVGLLGPLLDDSGDFYRITMPKIASQLTADRQARLYKGITVQAQLAGAMHSLNITVNANI